MIINLEGIDGSGKSTQAAWLFGKLQEQDPSTNHQKFPDYETPCGKVIEDWLHQRVGLRKVVPLPGDRREINTHYTEEMADAMALQACYTANRIERHDKLTAYKYKSHLVVDRYWPSGVAYGCGIDGLDYDWMVELSMGLPQADLYILVDISVSEALKRQTQRGRKDRYENQVKAMEQARDMYLRLWAQMQTRTKYNASCKWVVVNGEMIQEGVANQIWDQLVKFKAGLL